MFHKTIEKAKKDNVLNLAKGFGYVPKECKLDGLMVLAIKNRGKNPCDGCNILCEGKNKKPEIAFKASTLGALLNGDIENASISATPGGIEAQEAQGQQDMVSRCLLPINWLGKSRMFGDDEESNRIKQQLTDMGVVFGEVADEIFYECKLPVGWKLKADLNHSMWSYLYDETGKEIAAIFYKAAFYDRSSFGRLSNEGDKENGN